uniref:Uncharacterized protein n=1 Tax=Cacopsylla melanoneura TaxID=428564 RepID=A0A8D8XSW4_9HEMI
MAVPGLVSKFPRTTWTSLWRWVQPLPSTRWKQPFYSDPMLVLHGPLQLVRLVHDLLVLVLHGLMLVVLLQHQDKQLVHLLLVLEMCLQVNSHGAPLPHPSSFRTCPRSPRPTSFRTWSSPFRNALATSERRTSTLLSRGQEAH